jgi:hypothetical protein
MVMLLSIIKLQRVTTSSKDIQFLQLLIQLSRRGTLRLPGMVIPVVQWNPEIASPGELVEIFLKYRLIY